MLFEGMLVELPGHRGLAKLQGANRETCSVAVFYSASRTETIELRLDALRRGLLSPQTRVYVFNDGVVRVGRVTDYLQQANGLVDYEVRFPNGRQADFNERDLFVRPWDAPEDPAEVLAFGGAESQFLHDRRQSAVDPLTLLRGACQGLTALVSAGIDFVPHQIAAVRRILTDPIQRYLLADEVGLGKTIEAGLVIRQRLIDDPDTTVLISAPPHLRDQWRQELSGKLRLDQFPHSFEIITHQDLERVSRAPDILVVDEAHHLVGLAEGPLSKAGRQLVHLAHAAPTLLLLSATPPLGDEHRFLALLNLLDPDVHRLDDPDAFRAKLEQRREIGRLLLSLDAESPGLVLRQRAADVVRLFPADAEVARLGPMLSAATREDPDAVESVCNELKAHIADTYRLHQRLIRSRRADAQGWEFRPRGPKVVGSADLSHLRVEAEDESELTPVLSALQEWRFSAIDAATMEPDLTSGLARRYGELIERVGGPPDRVATWFTTASATFDGEGDLLANLASALTAPRGSQNASLMVESTRRLLKALGGGERAPKIVAFASSGEAAEAFHTALGASLGEAVTTALAVGGDGVAAVEAFLGSKTPAVLVLDECGEEGLNLARADAIVHLDLPVSAARLEQRIGRLDRFGRTGDVIRHRFLLPSDDDDSPWQAWLDFLGQGLMIFNESTSDVQFLLQEIEEEALSILLKSGPEGLSSFAPEVRRRVEEERRSQHEQYALDRLALVETPIEPFIDAMEEAESDEAALESGMDTWFVRGLQLKKRPVDWPSEDPFRLSAQPQTLIPRVPWLERVATENTAAATWRRRTATKRPDVVLLRPGAPMLDTLERFTRWDDRGTAFMTWRTVPGWSVEPWLGFRLCVVGEPSASRMSALAPTTAELAAERRAEGYFQRQTQTIYIDINGRPVEDERLLDILKRPYLKGAGADGIRDLNLGSRQDLLGDLVDKTAFQAICRAIRETAREQVLGSDMHRARVAQAVEAANGDLRRRQRRLSVVTSSTGASETDAALIERIIPWISNPRVRLDAMGLFVVARTPPDRSAHGTA